MNKISITFSRLRQKLEDGATPSALFTVTRRGIGLLDSAEIHIDRASFDTYLQSSQQHNHNICLMSLPAESKLGRRTMS